jgi:hypothetical protein
MTEYEKGYLDGQENMRKRLSDYVLSCKETGVKYVQVYEVMANQMMGFCLLTPPPSKLNIYAEVPRD